MADNPLADGAHSVSVVQQDAAGNASNPVTASFVIDTHVPAAPTLDAPQSPTANPDVTFTGRGEAGARVSVLDSYSRLLCSAAVAASGAWNCAAPGVADGDYLLTALQATLAGRTSGPSAAISLSVRTLQAPLFDALASPTRNSWRSRCSRRRRARSTRSVRRTPEGSEGCLCISSVLPPSREHAENT